jgi:hypothetical protein
MKSVTPLQDRQATVRAARDVVKRTPLPMGQTEIQYIRKSNLIWPGNFRSPQAMFFFPPGPQGDVYDT